MTCPYCNNEMKSGSVTTTRGRLSWTPDGEVKSFSQFIVASVSDNSIEFGKWDLFGAMAAAQYCPNCKKIIIDV